MAFVCLCWLTVEDANYCVGMNACTVAAKCFFVALEWD